ncbi:hypothetical protein SNEBB_007890 [Seison nebaliae]|nr:hypothetical protein SNEBB_007890 [Seison nebaliae]
MNIDNFLRKKQLPKFVDCCNLHDLCYASCEPGHTRNICDHQFSQCLNEVCEEMAEEDQMKKIIRRCKKYARRIYGAVDHLGCMFYLRRKEKSGCECRYINSTQLATKKCTGTIDCILRSFWSFGSKVVG